MPAFLLILLLFVPMASATQASGSFTPESTVGDLRAHPAFRGCSRFLLPLDMGATEEMKLGETNRLLPYHSHIRTEESVRCLNAMAEAAAQGQQLFYPVYTQAERRADSSREEAGVFFFPGKKGAPFALICPGGGFTYVGAIHEGFPHARRIAAQGYSAFVLHYRTGNGNAACKDMAAAVTYLLGHAEQLGIRREGYSVWGSSAGARAGRCP